MDHALKLQVLHSLRKIQDLCSSLDNECYRLEQLFKDPLTPQPGQRGLRVGSLAYRAYEFLWTTRRACTAEDILHELYLEPTSKAQRDLRKTLRAYAKQGRYFEEFWDDGWWYCQYEEVSYEEEKPPKRKRRRRRRRKPATASRASS